MNNELPLYQGAMPQAAQQQFAQVPKMPRLQMYGEQLDGAIAAGLDAVDKYADLHDFGVRQETEHKLRQNELEMQQEFERKSRLAPGAEGSFFTADGNLNEDAVAVFTDKWQQRNREVARPYWKRESAMRGEEQVLAQNDRLAGNVGLGLMKMESQHRQQAFKDNYDLAVAQGDTAGACRIVDDAVASGQVTEARGNVMKLGLVRGALRSAGGRRASSGSGGEASISVNGSEYTDFSAALAAQKAKDGGYKTEAPEDGSPEGSGGDAATTASGESSTDTGENTEQTGTTVEAVDAGGTQEKDAPMPGIPVEPDTLTATAVTPSAYDKFFATGDFGSVLPLVPQADVTAFADAVLAGNYAITAEPSADGSTQYTCSGTAPEAVERTTAQANADGEITPESARSMVAAISLSMFTENPGATPESVAAVFKDSGVFEAMGGGDAEVGKAMVGGMVMEMQERSQHGTTKLGMKAIEGMIDAHVASPKFRVDGEREWHDKEWKAPYYDSDGKYKKPSDEALHDRWMMWFNLYKQYRTQFNPSASGEVKKGEFEENASAFYTWYMKNPYKEQKEADAKAAKDWYTAEVTAALMGNMGVDANGRVTYGSYANDIAVAKAVLSRKAPANNGVDALATYRERQDEAAAKLSGAFRKRAEAHYQNLREAKANTGASIEKARKAKEREEKAAERKEEQAQKAAEAAEKRKQVQMLNVERNKPRETGWEWDGEPAGQGAIPTCTLPESEYQALFDKLGYDGTQMVYVQVQGAKFLVTGDNKTGKMQLNAPAVAKLQGKRKKGDKLVMSGKMSHSYYFKTLNNK